MPTDQSLYESGLSSKVKDNDMANYGPAKAFDNIVDNSKEKLYLEIKD